MGRHPHPAPHRSRRSPAAGGKRGPTLSEDSAPRPAWRLRELRPLLRTPERRLSSVEARRGLNGSPQPAPKKRTFRFHRQALGAVVGVYTGETKAHLLLNFTAGGFVYVATVDVLPQLLRECSAWQSVKELLAMCAGIGLMLLVMALE